MMCIPFICMFICMFVGLPGWVCVVCGLVEKRSFLFSFGLSFPCSFRVMHCFVQMLVCSLGGNVSRSVRRLWGSVQAAAEFDIFDTLLRGMVIFYSYSLLCIIADCQDDLYCGVHVPYGDVLLRKLLICCCFCYICVCV